MKKIKFSVYFCDGKKTQNQIVEIIDNQHKEKLKAGQRSEYIANEIFKKTGFRPASFSQV